MNSTSLSPSAPTPAPPPDNASTATRNAGRGGIAVLGAKVFFLLTGFAQQPLLRLAVGLGDFGALAQALVVANTVNSVLVASGTQGVSRAVAAAPGYEDEALRSALRVHVPAALIIAGAMAAAAPIYAGFERADDVTAPLLVMAIVAFFYGLYSPLIGYLNGRNRFTLQAGLDVVFATLRTVGLVAFGHMFVVRGMSGTLGITWGWVAAAVCIVPLAVRWTGLGKPAPLRGASAASAASAASHGILEPRAYLAILLPIAGAQLCTNALLQIDIALLGRFLSESAATAGLGGAREAVKSWVAIYKECQTFAFLPYQLLFSVTLVLFPMLARAKAEGDVAAVRQYVARGARLAAIFGGLLVGVVVAMPEGMLAFAYGPADAARGADVLRMMVLAQGAFSMLGIATTVLTSIGRERTAALLTLAAVVAVGVACAVAVPGATFGHLQLLRSTEASGAALLATLIVAAVLVQMHTGAFLAAKTIARVGGALAACFALGFAMPHFPRLATPLVAAVVGAVFVGLLVVTGEIGRADLAMVRGLGGRRAPPRVQT